MLQLTFHTASQITFCPSRFSMRLIRFCISLHSTSNTHTLHPTFHISSHTIFCTLHYILHRTLHSTCHYILPPTDLAVSPIKFYISILTFKFTFYAPAHIPCCTSYYIIHRMFHATYYNNFFPDYCSSEYWITYRYVSPLSRQSCEINSSPPVRHLDLPRRLDYRVKCYSPL